MSSWKVRLLAMLAVAAMLVAISAPAAMAQQFFIEDEDGNFFLVEDCEDDDGDLVCDIEEEFDEDDFEDFFFNPFFVPFFFFDEDFDGIDDNFDSCIGSVIGGQCFGIETFDFDDDDDDDGDDNVEIIFS